MPLDLPWRESLGMQCGDFASKVFNLKTAVEREKAVHDIYVHREFTKLVLTL